MLGLAITDSLVKLQGGADQLSAAAFALPNKSQKNNAYSSSTT